MSEEIINEENIENINDNGIKIQKNMKENKNIEYTNENIEDLKEEEDPKEEENNNNKINKIKEVTITYHNTKENINTFHENENLQNIINKIVKDFKDDFNDLLSIKDELKNLESNKIFLISFIWLVWLSNLSIFTSKNLSNLFLTNINNKILFFIFFLCSLFIIIMSKNIIKNNIPNFYTYIIFWVYFILLFLILCKSLLYSNGWGWQFYLIIILINLNLFILSNFNLIEKIKPA